MIEKFSNEYIAFLEKNKLLPLNETAKILNLHPATLRNLAKTKSIKFTRIGKKFYFNIEDIKNNPIEKNYLPKGIIINDGHVKIRVGDKYPGADANGYVTLSRLIVENILLKRLNENERIKFKNKNTLDNSIDNLEVVNV